MMSTKMVGKVRKASVTRINAESIQPPKYPLNAPTSTPSPMDRNVETSPTASETRPPYKMRVKTSRPSSSVPNQ